MSTRSGRHYQHKMNSEMETSQWIMETTQRVVEVGLTEGKMGVIHGQQGSDQRWGR